MAIFNGHMLVIPEGIYLFHGHLLVEDGKVFIRNMNTGASVRRQGVSCLWERVQHGKLTGKCWFFMGFDGHLPLVMTKSLL